MKKKLPPPPPPRRVGPTSVAGDGPTVYATKPRAKTARPVRGKTSPPHTRAGTAPVLLDAIIHDALPLDDDSEPTRMPPTTAQASLEAPTTARPSVGPPLVGPLSGGMPAARPGPPAPPPARGPLALDALDDSSAVRTVEPGPVTSLPPLPALRVAVWESHGHLGSAQDAIIAAGHDVAGAGAGSEGHTTILGVIREGQCDVLVVALPPVAPGSSLQGGAPGDAAGALIDAALALEPRRPVIIAALAGGLALGARRAAAAGADLVIARPHDADKLAPALLAASRLLAERRTVTAARGSEAAMRARLDQVAQTDGGGGGLEPFELFQRAVEIEIKRARRYAYPLAVALFAVEIAPPPPPPGVRGILRARIGNALVRAIRDIDMATQLDHERFLVLLPYTDLTGAASLGQRVIGAVAGGDPVNAGGRTFPLRVVGAVAGASPGQPLSFSRLMKDASRALEQARRDGAELAVQP